MVIERSADGIKLVEKNYMQRVYGVGALGAGLVMLFVGSFSALIPSLMAGVFFVFAGFFMLKYAEVRTVTLRAGGVTTIEYRRVIGKKNWVRAVMLQDIKKLDYVKGFDVGRIFGEQRWCTLYLDVTFGEQIEIAQRFKYHWGAGEKGFRVWMRSRPLDSEAAEVASLLGVPVNTISYLSAEDVLNNVYVPRDKMAQLLHRPTQATLNQERDAQTRV